MTTMITTTIITIIIATKQATRQNGQEEAYDTRMVGPRFCSDEVFL